jgi:hypothetical protein
VKIEIKSLLHSIVRSKIQGKFCYFTIEYARREHHHFKSIEAIDMVFDSFAQKRISSRIENRFAYCTCITKYQIEIFLNL